MAIFLTSCKSQEIMVLVKVPTTSLKDDVNRSIVEDFYGGDTLGKKVWTLK